MDPDDFSQQTTVSLLAGALRSSRFFPSVLWPRLSPLSGNLLLMLPNRIIDSKKWNTCVCQTARKCPQHCSVSSPALTIALAWWQSCFVPSVCINRRPTSEHYLPSINSWGIVTSQAKIYLRHPVDYPHVSHEARDRTIQIGKPRSTWPLLIKTLPSA